MSIPKFRAAIVVFIVGFALGVSVFAASRLFVRAVLNDDAIRVAQELAADVASGKPITASAALSSVERYSYYNLDGDIIESAAPGSGGSSGPALSDAERTSLTGLAASGGTVIEDVPLITNLIGLSESPYKRVAVPVVANGDMVGSLFVEVDQSRALESLTRAFSVVGMVTIGLAVLAVIAVAFVVTRGRGFRDRKVFDPNSVARDALTDVAGRDGFREILNDAVERAAEADQQVLLMIVDLDRFRSVNGIWGHPVGDKVLKMAGERLRAFATAPTGVGRISGDEFALIIEGDLAPSARHVADKIRGAISEPFEVDGASIMLSASVGAALYPINADSGDMLFRAAAGALSKAKTEGRNALAVFDTEMKERMERNEALERDLRAALEREEFVVFYQPQLELASGRLRGYEALVRWERPGEGILSPRDFLAVAEETGLIRPIGEWVLHKACEDAASWLDSGSVAVNLSAAQFRAPDIDKTIASVLEDTGLAADRLEIEVPERLFLDGAPDTMETLNRIKALGVRIAMDDFGSGYSGLASLARFPFDKIKIDRRFVSQLTEDADVAAIVASIVALGRTLSVDVTAEGVETSEQVTLLKAAGCSIVQGFLFGVPKRETRSAAGTDVVQGKTGTAEAAEPTRAAEGGG
jgi:diguanylate cyclase (GGDEF)-like protein